MVKLRLNVLEGRGSVTLKNGVTLSSEWLELSPLEALLSLESPYLEYKFQLKDEDGLLNLSDKDWNYLCLALDITEADKTKAIKALLPKKKSVKSKVASTSKTVKDTVL